MVTETRLPRGISPAAIKPSTEDNTPIGRDFSVQQFFENGFPFAVKVVLRSGFAVILPAHNAPERIHIDKNRNYDFLVRTRYTYSPAVKIDANNVLDGVSTEGNRERMAMALAAAQVRNYAGNTFNTSSYIFSTDVVVTRAQFEEEGGFLYIPECDIVVTRAGDVETVHPHSVEGRAIIANESGDLVGYLYRVEIVDPYNQFGSRFVNIAGNVDKVEPVKDLLRQPGVYLHRAMRKDNNSTSDIKTEYFSFEDAAAKLKLFRTLDEAKALGDMEESRKREYEEQAAENKLKILNMEKELKEAAINNQKIQDDIETKTQEIKHLRAIADAKREERLADVKETYEVRSHQRKDSSELMKWLPAIVVGIGALVVKFWPD